MDSNERNPLPVRTYVVNRDGPAYTVDEIHNGEHFATLGVFYTLAGAEWYKNMLIADQGEA